MNRQRVTCIVKTCRYRTHERISHIGGYANNGTNWFLSQEEAIKMIEKQTHSFYIALGAYVTEVVVAYRDNAKYLKAASDEQAPDMLLSLAEDWRSQRL